MTRLQKIGRLEHRIEAVVRTYRRLTAATEAARLSGCLDIDGPLHEAIWRGFDDMLALIDADGWLAWYLWDNACGANRMEARARGDRPLRKIGTPRQLARLMVDADL